jgi:gliding motility-associated-like protein
VYTTFYSQTKLFSDTPVSDNGAFNNIGSANTSRNVAIDKKGNIFVVYANNTEVRLAKSTNHGLSFLPSILIGNAIRVEPEISLNNTGIVHIAWIDRGDNLFFANSIDEGNSFSIPRIIHDDIEGAVHMSSFENHVYLINEYGEKLFSNHDYGNGNFTYIDTGVSMVYADVLVAQNGIVYVPTDDPETFLYQSIDNGATLTETRLARPGSVNFSSYTISEGPCGTFIFVGGGEDVLPTSNYLGYKMNVFTGDNIEITLGEINAPVGNEKLYKEARTLYADTRASLIDGYRTDHGELMISISTDQGTHFNPAIFVSKGESHNITRDPTTNNISVVYEKEGEIFLSVYEGVLKSIEIEDTSLSFCDIQSFDLPFTLKGLFSPNTNFTVSLSDEFGDFTNSVIIGSIQSNTSGIINCTLPDNLVSSSLYRLKLQSLENCTESNTISLAFADARINGLTETCAGNTIELTSNGTPRLINPWISSDITVATVDSEGLVTTLKGGTTEISFYTDNNCSSSHSIEVFDFPIINEKVSLQQCDSDTDGLTTFNLTEVNSKIVDDTSSYTLSYFETKELAINNNEPPISDIIEYQNEIATKDKIWVRVENANNCFKISEVDLLVSTTKIPSDFTKSYYKCNDGTDLINGVATFDFSSVNNDIVSLFPISQQLIISYYENEGEALAEENEIKDISNYKNISNPQTIYIRVDSKLDNSCLGLGPHVILNIEEAPVANSVAINSECDNDRDGLFSFDTSTIESTIIGTQSNVTVSYFDQFGVELSSPLPNPFKTASQTITATIINNTSLDPDGPCSVDTTLINFIVNPVPITYPVAPLENCDDDTDGIIGFDTSEIENTLLGGQTGLIVRYFDENNTELSNPLPNPFFTTSIEITARVENPLYDVCYEETIINFIVKEKPTIDLLEEDIICMTDNPYLEIVIENPNEDYSYIWKDKHNAIISNLSTASVTKGGVYSVIATSSISGCNSEETKILIKESSISTITIDDIEINDNSDNSNNNDDNNIQINTLNLGLGDYEFRLLDETNTIIREYQDEPFFENLEGGIYTIEVNDKNGCGSITLKASLLGFPEFFTPNGDGINDIWQVGGVSIDFYKSGEVNVFDRYGKFITTYSINDNTGWDGTYNGFALPSNDYWFSIILIDKDDNISRRVGHFSLIRKKFD